ncbi:MAG: putative permease [Saliniramus fredricksonii]|uniref:Probable membrane transporter protein n=1 Tax=Saliniramus fredricksonii TaxID=1653334 RepID=A0A0N8KDJ7_9HYPH|nr:TSUP family transporter [Saliniramus fredricksonii]KPQ08730.1 MAG: putative permease [Saliniramus fredricksonii]SCC81675.1 Sulfite exporter TauE/SafE [Saliniramus fredricksonii]
MTRPRRPGLSFGIGALVGTAGGLIGLGGAEFRLPALVRLLRFNAREAVAVNLVASFIVLAAAFPFRAAAVPLNEIGLHLPAVLGMLAGSMTAAWIGAGWLRRVSERLLGRLILILLVGLGLVLIAEGVFVAEPTRLVGEGAMVTIAVAAACGIGIGLTRHFGTGAVLREGPVWRATILPLGLGSVLGAVIGALTVAYVPAQALKIGLGIILIWSAWGVFRHLPQGHDAKSTR